MELSDFGVCERIMKGWSEDEKYLVRAKDGGRLLLRLSPSECLERKRLEYKALETAAGTGIPMTRPLSFGTLADGRVYSLLTWADGSEATDEIKRFPPLKQYELGRRAGEYLKRLHALPAKPDTEKWETYFSRKMDRKLKMYADCELKYKDGGEIANYVRESRGLIAGRESCFQHGDYHIGNMVLTDGGELSVIDFNRFDYGDPWEEFNRIVWCAESSPMFATGRIDGYFLDDVPSAFFPLMKLYIYSNQLSHLPWAIPFGKADIDTAIKLTQKVLGWYKDGNVPEWYVSSKKVLSEPKESEER